MSKIYNVSIKATTKKDFHSKQYNTSQIPVHTLTEFQINAAHLYEAMEKASDLVDIDGAYSVEIVESKNGTAQT